MVTEGKILNRIIRACPAGWEYECDQRHVEVIIEELDLLTAKPVVTPGTDEVTSDEPSVDSQLLEPARATSYRALAARANYISVDSADCQYAIKELCRVMSAPTEESWLKLKRVAKYLKGRPRAVLKFHWQTDPASIDVFTDANWAGCRQSRKSTSGGCVMMGTACVKSWSKTQATIAQSSAESELLASVKGAVEALGIVSLGKDLGIDVGVRLHLDAAAALGILERRGVGRVRHLDVASLWLQEKELRRIIEMHKVSGLENPADLDAKHLTRYKIDKCCDLLGYSFVDGRSTTTSNLHSIRTTDGWSPGAVDDRSLVPVGSGEARHWRCMSSTRWRGTFRGARAHRSPTCAGISWSEVVRMTTRKMPGNQLVRDIFPSQDRITERAACSSIGGSPDIRIDIEVGVPIDSNADNDRLRHVGSCDGSIGLSGGRAEHVSPRERRIHIDQYRQSILAQIVPGNPFQLIPHCAFSSGTLVAFDPCVSVVPRRADGSLSCLSRSVGVYNTVGIRNH